MDYVQAILLGIVQGLTEFLPISSSGHLVILQELFGMSPESDSMIVFDLAVHLATMGAILVYYRQSIGKYVPHLCRSLPRLNHPVETYRRSASIRFTVLAILATMVTGVVYVLLKDGVKQGFERPSVVAVCWIVTATLLLFTDRHKHTRRSLRRFGLTAALAVGLAQGLALFPGISRSGSTICVAVLWGLHRRWAGEFSFFIGVVAISGASLIEGYKFFSGPHPEIAWGPMAVGAVASFLVGWAALGMLIWAVQRAKLKWFAIYCYIIAAATLMMVLWK